VFGIVLPSVAIVNSMRRANMKNKLTLSIVLAAALTLSFIPNVYAGGPEYDIDEKYGNLPGSGECWFDGYNTGLEENINQNRLDECYFDPGNAYLDAWIYGCRDAGNTEDMCITFTDS
jgi:hypothetical protein